ncbi:hypothetical protein [Sandaracinus amylolyticus]|uniref:hypothetical protein n=1 Tax=Sandaracinus amylolyticus TaxID=927083 RepID=UPI001F328FBF|nr:hypothetical protein [Sandaracinus amylolyticus]
MSLAIRRRRLQRALRSTSGRLADAERAFAAEGAEHEPRYTLLIDQIKAPGPA